MSAISASISEPSTSEAPVTTTAIFSFPLSATSSSPFSTTRSLVTPSSSEPQTTTTAASLSSNFSLVSIPATAVVGGISITQPEQQQQSASPFYKIAPGQVITFGWTMTSVLATPTSLTLSAVCDNGNTYAVGPTDGVVPGTATEVVWDIWKYQTENPATPLAQAEYTLSVWDERGKEAIPKQGYFSAFGGFQFAMYTPQVYTSIEDGWQCSVCSGAGVNMVHPVFISMVVTFFLMFFSGFHLLRTSSRIN